MTDAPKPRVVRRVVTGHEHNNVAKVILDGPASNVKRPAPTFGSIAIWASDTMPVQIPAGQADEIEDCGQRILPTQPPPNGTRFIVMEFDPGAESAMHRTETIDYIACLEGEIDMDMDNSRVTLRAGDVMVQRGTNHAWMNRSKARARLAIVLIDAEPLGIGNPRQHG